MAAESTILPRISPLWSTMILLLYLFDFLVAVESVVALAVAPFHALFVKSYTRVVSFSLRLFLILMIVFFTRWLN